MVRSVKVRFHLGAGPHKGQWQIKRNKDVSFHDPATTTLIMKNCTLKNHRTTAEKIHAGQNKSVCCWIACESIFVSNVIGGHIEENSNFISYNPRIAPYWRNSAEIDIDNREFVWIMSDNKRLYEWID